MVYTFETRTPPRVNSNTHIVAVCPVDTDHAGHDKDGWLLSEFYAFNNLLNGLGASQTWLVVQQPETIVQKYGQYAHGRTGADKKVVLSQDLIDSKQVTPVTVIDSETSDDVFLTTVTQVTQGAAKTGGSVLIIICSYGLDGYEFHFSNELTPLPYRGEDWDRKISIERLKQTLAPDVSDVPHVPVCLLTPCCYRGGWAICPDITKTTSISSGILPGSACIWTDSTERALTTQITEQMTWVTSHYDLDAFHDFARNLLQVHDVCGLFPDDTHEFVFSETDPAEWTYPWETRENPEKTTTVSLPSYARRWAQLKTVRAEVENTGNPYNTATIGIPGGGTSIIARMRTRKIQQLVAAMKRTCMGDEYTPRWLGLDAFMSDCAEFGSCVSVLDPKYAAQSDKNGELEEELAQAFEPNPQTLFAIVQYRLRMHQIISHCIVDAMGLRRPGESRFGVDGQSLLRWNTHTWADRMADDPALPHIRTAGTLLQAKEDFGYSEQNRHRYREFFLSVRPSPQQGPKLHRFHSYLSATIVAMSPEDAAIKGDVLGTIMSELSRYQKHYEEIARANPRVMESCRRYMEGMGVSKEEL